MRTATHAAQKHRQQQRRRWWWHNNDNDDEDDDNADDGHDVKTAPRTRRTNWMGAAAAADSHASTRQQ
jgi:hypothetical protein